jgi:hypothetical protein
MEEIYMFLSHILRWAKKGFITMSVKIFNSLPNYLIDLIHDKKQFMKEIKDILTHNPSYTVDEFLCLCQDLQ